MLRIMSRRGDDRLSWDGQKALTGDSEAVAAVRRAVGGGGVLRVRKVRLLSASSQASQLSVSNSSTLLLNRL